MKIRIREGNDFDVVWAIKRAGVPEDLSTAINMKLTLVVYGLVIEHNLFTVTDNLLSINIPKEVATVNGDYRLIFEYTLPDAGQPDGDLKCKTDVVPFRIVPFTAKADDIYTINVTSDIAFGFKGDKGDDGDDAYQIWLDLGNVGTYEDFIAYLRQPAVDAAESISELEQEISENEGERVLAESERKSAELIRIDSEGERVENENDREQAEGIRNTNEIDRIAAEGIRNTNETGRINAESDRMDAEVLREQAEAAREEAEDLRQTNITTAIQDAGEATTAANTAAGLADTARTELTTAVNTKLGEADDKIEEMDTTLSTYDGRVTQVESDITQLAGDVSLFKDEATVKLTNLITNGNFANGTTGWKFWSNITETSVADSILSFTGGGSIGSTGNNWISQTNTTVFLPEHVLYNIVTARSLMGARFFMGIGYPNSDFYLTDQWGTYSHLGSHYTHNEPTYGAGLGDTVEMTNAMCFDLTAIFGEGNEPTKEEMDLLISTLGTEYFEGEITIPAQKIMQWQLALIRKNKNAIIALGGTII